jgi:hypothetical protein
LTFSLRLMKVERAKDFYTAGAERAGGYLKGVVTF